jgi:hypothetical protein
MKNFGILLLLSTLIFSCNKVEGEGGTSSIIGSLTVNEFKNSGILKATYPGADEDVFIIYGKDNTTYNDKVSTSYDGTYRIDNLVKGTYKLFSYSEDTTASGVIEVLVEVNVLKNGEVVVAPELIIKN